MKRIIYISTITAFSWLASFGQNIPDFRKELIENDFIELNKKEIPQNVLKLLGYKKNEVGTKMSQTGCTSGKNIVLNWAVTNKNGFYVIKVSTCGAWTEPKYYIISKKLKYEINMRKCLESFNQFKKEYFNLLE